MTHKPDGKLPPMDLENQIEGGRVTSFDTVREVAGGLPGAVEGTSYSTPAFYVGKTLFVRQHPNGESLVVRIDSKERAVRVAADPKTYSVTDHYVNYPWVQPAGSELARKPGFSRNSSGIAAISWHTPRADFAVGRGV